MGNQEWTIHKHLHHWCTHYTGRRQTYQKQKTKQRKQRQKQKKQKLLNKTKRRTHLTHQSTVNQEDEQIGPHHKTGGEPRYSRMVSSSRFYKTKKSKNNIILFFII